MVCRQENRGICLRVLASSIKRDIGHLCHDETPSRPSNISTSRRSSSLSSTPSKPVSTGQGPSNASPFISDVHTNPLQPQDLGNLDTQSNQLQPHELGNVNAGPTLSGPALPSQTPLPTLSLTLPPDMISNTESLSSTNWGPSVLGGAGFLGLGGGGPSSGGADMTASGDAAGGNEYNILSEFLESLDGTSALPTPSFGAELGVHGDLSNQKPAETNYNPIESNTTAHVPADINSIGLTSSAAAMQNLVTSSSSSRNAQAPSRTQGTSITEAATIAANSKTETFFLTAADQKDGSRDERLGRVIQAKLDAGLLRPYNHVKGYARLNRWMEQNCSQASKRRILKPLSVFRPAFRAIAQRLTNVDLIFIEEAFERLLLDYDRVFSTQGMPACLWRRTGEIYKGNKEFADLVGVSVETLREGKCAIYELMQEDSAVNYWEKYGAVCFDPGQKAVLTSCVLTTKRARKRGAVSQTGSKAVSPSAASKEADIANTNTSAKTTAQEESPPIKNEASSSQTPTAKPTDSQSKNSDNVASTQLSSTKSSTSGLVSCCFSFTIRRDAWGIPYAIIGNFLPIPETSAEDANSSKASKAQ